MSLASDRDGPFARSTLPRVAPSSASTLFDVVDDGDFYRFVTECATVFQAQGLEMLFEFLDLVTDVVATAVSEHGIGHFPFPFGPLGYRKVFVRGHPGAERQIVWIEVSSLGSEAIGHRATEFSDAASLSSSDQYPAHVISVLELASQLSPRLDLLCSRWPINAPPAPLGAIHHHWEKPTPAGAWGVLLV